MTTTRTSTTARTGTGTTTKQCQAETAAAPIRANERGQTTAEYALVLLAAGTIAMLVVSWAQGNDAVGTLFDTILSRITSLSA